MVPPVVHPAGLGVCSPPAPSPLHSHRGRREEGHVLSSFISCPSLPSLFFSALSPSFFKHTMVIYLYLILKVPSTLPSLPLGLGLGWSKWEVQESLGHTHSGVGGGGGASPLPPPPHYLLPSTLIKSQLKHKFVWQGLEIYLTPLRSVPVASETGFSFKSEILNVHVKYI